MHQKQQIMENCLRTLTTKKQVRTRKHEPVKYNLAKGKKRFNNPKVTANLFNGRFTTPAKHQTSISHRQINGELCKRNLNEAFQMASTQVKNTIRRVKYSKTLVPAGISLVLLNHFATHSGIKVLADTFNSCLPTSSFPTLSLSLKS